MKKYWKKIMAAAGIAALMNTMTVFAGTWEKEGDFWLYLKDNGQYAKEEWVQDEDGSWYYFGRFEDMKTNQLIDGYYVGADGRMLSEQDVKNPLHGEEIYGTCYLSVNSYTDEGTYYKANVNLYDSSFGTTEDFSQYNRGDKFWIESKGAYGKVTAVNFSTSGAVSLEVTCGGAVYSYDPESTFVSEGDGEGVVLRTIEKNVEVKIPKTTIITPSQQYPQFKMTLEQLLDTKWYKAVPVFNGDSVEKLYDTYMNYAG